MHPGRVVTEIANTSFLRFNLIRTSLMRCVGPDRGQFSKCS